MRYVAIDTETTGLNPFLGAYPFCFIMTWDPAKVEYTIPEGDVYVESIDGLKTIVTRDVSHISNILEDPDICKIFHNAKFDLQMLEVLGQFVLGPIFCTMVAAHLVDENRSKKLATQVEFRLPPITQEDIYKAIVIADATLGRPQDFIDMVCASDIKEECKDKLVEHSFLISMMQFDSAGQRSFITSLLSVHKKNDRIDQWFARRRIKSADRNYADVPWDLMREYAAADAFLTYRLAENLNPILKDQNLLPVFSLEMSVMRVYRAMQRTGLRVDMGYLYNVEEEYKTKQIALLSQIQQLAPGLNINSPQQLSRKLRELGATLPETKTGYKVDEKTLKALVEAKDEELSWIEVSAAEGYLAEVQANPAIALIRTILEYRKVSKLLGTYIQPMLGFARKDGRIHANINQCSARTGRTSSSEPNLQNLPKDDKTIRRAIVPDPGKVMFAIDFKQQEFRVFAASAGMAEVVREINENDTDFYQLVVDKVSTLRNDPDPKKARKKSKVFNLMTLYGAGIKKIAAVMGVDTSEGNVIKEDYFRTFPDAKKFMTRMSNEVGRFGYIVNPFGRRRRLATDQGYKGVNAYIQGSCADYIKAVMVRIYDTLPDVEILMMVHDELIVQVDENRVSELIPQVCDIMSDSMGIFGIKLTVDPEIIRTNWADKEPWNG